MKKRLHLLIVSIFLVLCVYAQDQMRSNLYGITANSAGNYILMDGWLALYKNTYSESVKIEDALKFTNINENFGLKRHDIVLAVERRPIIGTLGYTDTSHMWMWKMGNTNYRMEFIGSIANAKMAKLQDLYLGTETVLNLNGITTVYFVVDKYVPGSFRPDRFRIVYYRSKPAIPGLIVAPSDVEKISVSPNPVNKSNSEIVLGFKKDYGESELSIFGPQGQPILVKKRIIARGTVRLFFQSRIPGVYVIYVQNKKGEHVSQKIVISE